MTLIFALGNRDATILLADRRLTSTVGRAPDITKATALITRDARAGVAFCGLAQAPGFDTSRWILEALPAVAKPDYEIGPMIGRMTQEATERIARLPLSVSDVDRRLTIVFAGYGYSEPSLPRWFVARVSNFELGHEGASLAEAQPSFECHWDVETKGAPRSDFGYVFGESAALVTSEFEAIHQLLHRALPPDGVVGKAVEVMRDIAQSQKSGGVIGEDFQSLVVPSDPYQDIRGDYHPANSTEVFHGVNLVRADPDASYSMGGVEIKAFDGSGNPERIVPKTGRNVPCPCGSGKKYKRCHGVTSG
jgi:hypothetical protein